MNSMFELLEKLMQKPFSVSMIVPKRRNEIWLTAASCILDEWTLYSGCLSSQAAKDLSGGHLSAGSKLLLLRLKTAIGCSAIIADVEHEGLGISPGSNTFDVDEAVFLFETGVLTTS